jgi:hypothetical protein
MNRILALGFIALSFASVSVSAAESSADVVFRGDSANTKFHLSGDKTKAANLSYEKTGRKKSLKPLTPSAAQAIRSEIRQIVWTSLYKTPTVPNCTAYADLALDGKKTTICRENADLTGRVYGLLHALRARFTE